MITVHSKNLCWFSKVLVLATLFLIFAGALVKSFEVGLSVPDWPTTYGYQMFAYPWADMVGGIFYEHGHRMIATFVGALTLVIAIWLGIQESRKPVKILGYSALALVIIQGLLGGLTVLLFLPAIVSLLHGVIAQTFLLVVILIAYLLSKEFSEKHQIHDDNRFIVKIFLAAIYLQLILGAWMRHTESGLAIYDFPKMAGYWFPVLNETLVNIINNWRFGMDLPDVLFYQVLIHLTHRLGALIIFILMIVTHYKILHKPNNYSKTVRGNLYLLDFLVVVQIMLGAITIWTVKGPFITSFHVLNGAAVMGLCFLLLLRLSDLSFLKG